MISYMVSAIMNVDKFGNSEFFDGETFHVNHLSCRRHDSLANNKEIDDTVQSLKTKLDTLGEDFNTLKKTFDEKIRVNKNSIVELKVQLNDIESNIASNIDPIVDKYKRDIEVLEQSVKFYRNEIEIAKNRLLLERADDYLRGN
ncbi:hypothetical protein QAD02_007242 [Eretmocerus hayati]|uniref:Uncharacterized protein n=1 Tax=Eretmocerus hayati TaxID=131215 RepID=A0ACC2N7G4_9HYME|nr:hypothetical protein QAD02_007242 [Eretmocerus hayati]